MLTNSTFYVIMGLKNKEREDIIMKTLSQIIREGEEMDRIIEKQVISRCPALSYYYKGWLSWWDRVDFMTNICGDRDKRGE